jgi:hypothetical protein
MSNLEMNTVATKEAIIDCFKAKVVPMVTGSPGIGKSSIVNQIAKDFNLQVIDLRLSQSDPTDLNGFPTVNEKTGKAGYIPMETFPLATDALPAGKDGWILFLDEFNSAPRAVQAASYKLVLDRAVGTHKLHENVMIVCAGNKETDNAIVNEMSTAMQSRMVHLELGVDHEAWVAWAETSNVDHRVVSYIKFKPTNLFMFNPDHQDKTFACPRTWEFVSNLIKNIPLDIPRNKTNILAGAVGEGAGREFMGFCKIYKDLPTIQQILANPLGLKIPEEPSQLYAISGSLGTHAKDSTIDALMQYVKRLPVEFQMITLQNFVRKDKSLMLHKAVTDWVNESAISLF